MLAEMRNKGYMVLTKAKELEKQAYDLMQKLVKG